MDPGDRRLLARVGNYQFGAGAGEALLANADALECTHTASGRPRQLLAPAGHVATYGTDGRLRLGIEGGRRLHEAGPADAYRVVVGDESEPFVREGRNVFAKFVDDVDPAVRPRDEVVVVHADGHLLAVGRAELPARGMRSFQTGMAVKVRAGRD